MINGLSLRPVPKPVDTSWTAIDGSFLEAARRLRGLYESS